MIKAAFTKHQADFLARQLKSHLTETENIRFDPTVNKVRHDWQACLDILKAAGASDL